MAAMPEVEKLYSPDRMSEATFLALLLRLMESVPPEARRIPLYDLELEIVLPSTGL